MLVQISIRFIWTKARVDYSGYNRQQWPLRTLTTHKEAATQYAMAKTPTEQKRVLSTFGVRYSSLLNLPYFDPIRFHVVDPMHILVQQST